MPFHDILGHDVSIRLLQDAVREDDLPQSLLFVGPEGIGKTTVAMALAQRLCCLRPVENDACGTCVNCQRVERGEHPDVQRIAPDGEQTKIWQFWSRPGHPPGVLESLPFAPVAASCRIYILEKAETLNEESANSILKALEEPPSYVRFILCAPAPDSVLPTIRSRCRIVRFAPVAADLIAQWLKTRHDILPASGVLWASYAQGAPGRALRLAQSPDTEAQRNAVVGIGERIAQSTGVAAFRLAEELRDTAKGKAKSKSDEDEEDAGRTTRGDLARVLEMLALWYGDLLRASTTGASGTVLFLHDDRRDAIIAAAAKYRPEQISACIENIFLFRRYIQRNANAQLVTETLLLRLIPRRTAG